MRVLATGGCITRSVGGSTASATCGGWTPGRTGRCRTATRRSSSAARRSGWWPRTDGSRLAEGAVVDHRFGDWNVHHGGHGPRQRHRRSDEGVRRPRESSADRLLDRPFEILPDAKLFARDTELRRPHDWHPSDGAPSTQLAEQLGLTEVLDRLQKASPSCTPLGTAARDGNAVERFEAVLKHAAGIGQHEVLEELLAAADRLGLYTRPYVESVMFTPPTNRTRMLLQSRPIRAACAYGCRPTHSSVLPGDLGRRGAAQARPSRAGASS